MPVLVEINGLDEAGRMGQSLFFTRVGIPLPSEFQTFIRNLEYFDKLFIGKKDLKGYDSTHLLKFVSDYIDDPSIDISLYCMRLDVQLTLFRELFANLATDLFAARGMMIKAFRKNWGPISKTMNTLNRFRRPGIYLESFMKACALHQIVSQLPNASRLYRTIGDIDRLLVVQIDGGYPFAFWWRQLLELPETRFKKGNFSVVGISNGDEYYPSLSTAGTIAHTIFCNPERRYLFPIREIRQIENMDLPSFYEEHKKAMTFPTFQNRLVFLGRINENVRRCIPYLEHLKDRSKIFEPFYVGTDVENYFKEFGLGSPENNLIVYGSLVSPKDKSNLRFCQEQNYPIRSASEYKDDFQKFVNSIEEELQLLPSQKRSSLSSKLKAIESSCISNLK